MTDSNDVGILNKKNELTITFDGTRIVIEDGVNRRGGNVAAKRGTKVSWANHTGGKCELFFHQFLPDDEDGVGGDIWPFHPEPQPTNKVLVIESYDQWSGTLALRPGGQYVEYSVKLTISDGNTFNSDPIIIIRT